MNSILNQQNEKGRTGVDSVIGLDFDENSFFGYKT
jgi:hypothetical protein